MTNGNARHPDLLRRFVATPYVFRRRNDSSRIRVESNELEIALGIWNSAIVGKGNWVEEMYCKIVRDAAGPVGGSDISILADGPLRVLYRGRGTILIYERERVEILGFLSSDVKAVELVSSLLPALFGGIAEGHIN
jgi:hypothetical protein